MRQLQVDIARVFEGARAQVLAYPSGGDDLVEALRRWIEGAMRFIEPHPAIRHHYRAVFEMADHFVGLSAMADGADRRAVKTARTHLVAALTELEAVIRDYGLLTAAGEKVGLGLAGTRI